MGMAVAVGNAACLHYFDDGQSCGAARLAVVAVAHDAHVAADDVGIAVVGGIGVLFANFLEEGKGFFLGFAGTAVSDEARFVDDEFILTALHQRFVGSQAHSAILSRW